MSATTVRRSVSGIRADRPNICDEPDSRPGTLVAGAVPKIKWSEHRLSVDGLVDEPTTFTMDDLLALPAREIPVTLVCAGNRRKEENLVKQTIGFNWGAAGVSTSVWKGVLLRDVLIKSAAPPPPQLPPPRSPAKSARSPTPLAKRSGGEPVPRCAQVRREDSEGRRQPRVLRRHGDDAQGPLRHLDHVAHRDGPGVRRDAGVRAERREAYAGPRLPAPPHHPWLHRRPVRPPPRTGPACALAAERRPADADARVAAG